MLGFAISWGDHKRRDHEQQERDFDVRRPLQQRSRRWRHVTRADDNDDHGRRRRRRRQGNDQRQRTALRDSPVDALPSPWHPPRQRPSPAPALRPGAVRVLFRSRPALLRRAAVLLSERRPPPPAGERSAGRVRRRSALLPVRRENNREVLCQRGRLSTETAAAAQEPVSAKGTNGRRVRLRLFVVVSAIHLPVQCSLERFLVNLRRTCDTDTTAVS